MLQRHHRHVEELNAVNQLLYTIFDPAQHLDLIIERLVSIMNFDVGLILLNQCLGDELVPAACAGLPDTSLPDLRKIVAGNAAAGEALSICRLMTNDDATAHWLRTTALCDMMIAPLTAGCDVLELAGGLLSTSQIDG